MSIEEPTDAARTPGLLGPTKRRMRHKKQDPYGSG
jgi:hypothetical protein